MAIREEFNMKDRSGKGNITKYGNKDGGGEVRIYTTGKGSGDIIPEGPNPI